MVMGKVEEPGRAEAEIKRSVAASKVAARSLSLSLSLHCFRIGHQKLRLVPGLSCLVRREGKGASRLGTFQAD